MKSQLKFGINPQRELQARKKELSTTIKMPNENNFIYFFFWGQTGDISEGDLILIKTLKIMKAKLSCISTNSDVSFNLTSISNMLISDNINAVQRMAD